MKLRRNRGWFARRILALVLIFAVQEMRATSSAAEAQALMKEEKFTEAAAILVPLAVGDDPDALMLLGLLEATGAGVARDASRAKDRWARAAHLGQRDAIRLLIPSLMSPFQRTWWSERLAAAPEPTLKVPLNMVRMERAWMAANEEAALTWNEQRAANGDPMALFNLHSLLTLDFRWVMDRKEDLLALLRKSALANYPPALAELADLYTPDPGDFKNPMRLVEANVKLSSTYMQRAADLGDDGAQLLWAHRLSSGRHGVEKNPILALEYYERSSEQGNSYAPYFLFEAYGEGEGVAKDEARALDCLKLAAARDNDTAMSLLGRRLLWGKGVPADEAAGVSLMMQSLVTEIVPDGDDMAIIASCLAHGRGIAKDEAAAFKWAEWAASKGSLQGKLQVGCQYMEGQGVPKDQAAGFPLLLAAAEGGYTDAFYLTAIALLQGLGTAKDLDAAGKWLEESRAKAPAHIGAATFLLAQLKMGAFGSKDYDPEAAKAFLTESISHGHTEAKLPLAIVEAESLNAAEAHERISRALNEALAEKSSYAMALLAQNEGDVARVVRRFVDRPPPPPDEAEIARRISALGVVPLNSMPRPVHQGAPRYPFLLAAIGRQGDATIEFIISAEGKVIEARVADATHSVFGEAAVHAVREWRFAPGMKGGRQVAVRVTQKVEFRLDDGPAEEAK